MSGSAVEPANESLEAQLANIAPHFPYPPTPDLAGSLKRRLATEPGRPSLQVRRLAWGMVAAIGLLVILLAVPPVRAAILEALRLGAVRIFLTEPTPTVTPTPPSAASPLPPPTPRPSPTPLASLLDLAGETTLAGAQAQVNFPIRLPAEPPDLGPPDRVFRQHVGGTVLVLVWLDPDDPGRIRLSLHHLGSGAIVEKVQPRVIRETTVHGRPALWTQGPYLLQLRTGEVDLRRLIDGNVLIWTEGEITYRLETDLSLAEAVRMAESLR